LASGKSVLVIFLVTGGGNAKIIVTAKVDIIIRRIAIFVDVFDIFEIGIAAKVGVGVNLNLLLFFLERNRLLGL